MGHSPCSSTLPCDQLEYQRNKLERASHYFFYHMIYHRTVFRNVYRKCIIEMQSSFHRFKRSAISRSTRNITYVSYRSRRARESTPYYGKASSNWWKEEGCSSRLA